MGQMSTIWQAKTHEALLRLDESGEGRKAGRLCQFQMHPRIKTTHFAVCFHTADTQQQSFNRLILIIE